MFLFIDLCVHFEPLLGWECTYLSYNLRTEKQVFEVNSQNIKQAIDIPVTFMLGIKIQKYIF